MNGFAHINIELTSRCEKSCFMCGRRKIEREYPKLAKWGDMPLEMVEALSKQTPSGVFVQLHNNGEPLLYPDLKEALKLFVHCHTGVDTNGNDLMKRADDLIGRIDTLTVSFIPKDPERKKQVATVKAFLDKKQDRKPLVTFRILGDSGDDVLLALAEKHNCPVAYRVLHSPMGSFDYAKRPVIPEFGVCTEILHKLSIDRYGNVSPCVRFDPKGKNIIANIKDQTLETIWQSYTRARWVSLHKRGRRSEVPLCAACHYWGCVVS